MRRAIPVLLAAAVVLSLGCRQNHPPEVRAPVGPRFGHPGSTYVFAASASDPDGDSVRIRFSWGDGDTSSWSEWTPPCGFAVDSHRWDTAGVFSVQAQAAGAHGEETGWSDAASMRVRHPEMTVAWKFETNGYVSSSPALGYDGTIYVASDDSNLYAIAPDGSLRWKHPANETRPRTAFPVVADDGSILFSNRAKPLMVLDPDGRLRWSSWRVSTPALGVNQAVLAERVSRTMTAFRTDSTPLWSFQAEASIVTRPVVDRTGVVYFATDDSMVCAVGPDGALLRQVAVYRDDYQALALGADGTFHLTTEDGAVHAVSASGELLWALMVPGGVEGGPVVGADGTVYFVTSWGFLYAIAPDGAELWHERGFSSWSYNSTPAIAADGVIYFGAYDGLLALNSNGSVRWLFKTPKPVTSSPAIGPDGKVYFGCDDHCIYAIWGSAPLADSPWPMLQHDPQHSGRAR